MLTQIDAEAVCRMLVVDAIIGNVDRHLTNVLVTQPTHQRGSLPVAIDHGLSMITESVTRATPLLHNFTAGIDGHAVTGRTTRWERLVAREQGTLRRLWRCAPLLELAATLGPKRIGAQTDLVRQLLDERVISSVVRALPDDIVDERPRSSTQRRTHRRIALPTDRGPRPTVVEHLTSGNALTPT